MRLLIATDAARPQVNGVVRSLEETARVLASTGIETAFITPAEFLAVPLPTYPEIRLALAGPASVRERVASGGFDALHIATEGPVGMAARRFCLQDRLAFTTSYHTRFPDYLRARLPVPLAWSYAWLRRFHAPAAATMVSTPALRDELAARGFGHLVLWGRGVDSHRFRPRPIPVDLPRPIFLFVGRLAVEKNVSAFLGLDLPGTKLVVGDGPERTRLEADFPESVFLGLRTGEDLARIYASADAFVFPSRTDTFGIVLLEALASGVPVAAFPLPGIRDAVGAVAALDEDLGRGALAALRIPRERCRAFALDRSWERSAREFLLHLAPLAQGDAAARSTRRPPVERGRELPPPLRAWPEPGPW